MLAASPGERLRTLRELLGLTQKQLEEMSGVSQAWISNVETGTREANDETLRIIASATDTPEGFFYVQESAIPLDSLRFRKQASASKSDTRRVHTFFKESFRVTEELLGFEEYPTPPLPFATGDEIDDDEMEDLAAQTREALRLAPTQPIPHLLRAMERAGIAIAPVALPDPGGEEGITGGTPGHYGVSYTGGVHERALVGYFPGHSGDRDRFTLAHELGHLVLHTFRPRTSDPEGEANRFAGALLVPHVRALADINEKLTLHEYARLKATWGVSMAALIQRGAAVDTIGPTRKRSLYVQLSRNGWRKKEPVEVVQEEPLLMWTVLSRRFGSRPYKPASERLSVHGAVLRSIAPIARRVPVAAGASEDGKVVQLGRR
ncbi:XRE family transcriptional regulator [Embleya sp. NPDC059259]|uniref:XRE family transcriptional regulator n=1 Tax=unclassified Embleya TaxID=2699296 RepID=UPI0036BFF383